jgi:hypothetical protein
VSPIRRRDLGSSYGTCASCREQAVLSMVETRAVRRGWQLLDRRFDPQPYRAVTCSACRATYPVRSTDPTPVRASGRDWDYAAQRA